MKLNLTERKQVEIEAVAIRCVLPVNYEDEDIPNDYPHRKGETWDITIDIDTGQIRDWPQGVEAQRVYMKVVDSGCYYLLGPDGGHLSQIENDYVPKCIPGEYGDYIDFLIDGAGRILNWGEKCNFVSVRRAFFHDE